MHKKEIIEVIDKILQEEGISDIVYFAKKPHEKGEFWFSDTNGFMHYNLRIGNCRNIKEITYTTASQTITGEGTEIHFDCQDYMIGIRVACETEYSDDEWLIVGNDENREGYTGKSMMDFLNIYFKKSEARDLLGERMEILKYSYELPSEYYATWKKEMENYILEHPNDIEMKYAYADVYIVNERSDFSKSKATEYVGKDILKYLNHLECELIKEDIISEGDITAIVANAYVTFTSEK